MDLNRATIIGNLTQDPEVRTTATGLSVSNIGVATNRVWTDKNGVKQERAEFHNCVLWGRLGEIAGEYLSKGRRIYIEGRLETRDWVGQDGVKRYRTEIIASNMIMLDAPRRSNAASSSQDPAEANIPVQEPEPPAPQPEDEIKVEDIPF